MGAIRGQGVLGGQGVHLTRGQNAQSSNKHGLPELQEYHTWLLDATTWGYV